MSLLSLLAALCSAGPLADVRLELAHHVPDPAEQSRLAELAQAEAASTQQSLSAIGPADGVQEVVLSNIAQNLARQREAGLSPSAERIERTVIAYEGFKARTFVTSGVFPKRYFGYFDEVGDTAAAEVRLRESTIAIVAAINGWQAEQGHPVRITDAEVAVTYISEGGAVHLTTEQSLLVTGFHPVYDVGLDDIAKGVEDHPQLITRIDDAAGTDLMNVVGRWRDDEIPPPDEVPGPHTHWLKDRKAPTKPRAFLRRYMTYEEAIAGTALMVLWEKEIADRKMAAVGAGAIMARPVREQFIVMSLVYNSGLLHKPSRWAPIRDFATGTWVFRASEANRKRRWALSVLPPDRALENLRTGRAYPDQPTAWLSAYHILQRYGGYEGLRRFTDTFDEEGMFVRR